MAHNSCDSHVGYVVWPQRAGSWKIIDLPFQCLLCPEVAISQQIHLWERKIVSNQPLESFNASLDCCRQELCASVAIWEGWNLPRTHLSGSRLSWSTLAKAKSWLVTTFHQWEEKLSAPFGSYSSPRLLAAAQESRFSLSGGIFL